jgi:hypothetical protein
LPNNKRGEDGEERSEKTKREQLVGCGGQVEPLVFDQADGGPTIQLPAAGRSAAPFVC